MPGPAPRTKAPRSTPLRADGGRPSAPKARRIQALRWLGVAAALATLAAVWADVEHGGPLSRLDPGLNAAIERLNQGGFPGHMAGELLSWPGSMAGTIAATVAVAAWWWSTGRRRLAVWGVASGLVLALAVTALKLAIDRAVPPADGVVRPGESFPSGHMVGAAGNLAILLFLWAYRQRWPSATLARRARAFAWTGWAALLVAHVAGRLLAQWHWATDLLAGAALGTAGLLATMALAPRPDDALGKGGQVGPPIPTEPS